MKSYSGSWHDTTLYGRLYWLPTNSASQTTFVRPKWQTCLPRSLEKWTVSHTVTLRGVRSSLRSAFQSAISADKILLAAWFVEAYPSVFDAPEQVNVVLRLLCLRLPNLARAYSHKCRSHIRRLLTCHGHTIHFHRLFSNLVQNYDSKIVAMRLIVENYPDCVNHLDIVTLFKLAQGYKNMDVFQAIYFLVPHCTGTDTVPHPLAHTERVFHTLKEGVSVHEECVCWYLEQQCAHYGATSIPIDAIVRTLGRTRGYPP